VGHDGGFQPYKAGQPRDRGPALQSMLAGEGSMGNPQDVKRQVQKQSPGGGAGTDAKRAPVQSQVLARFIAKHARPSG
jgi:hypothetical protein